MHVEAPKSLEVVEVKNEGWYALLGLTVEIMCGNYIYVGILRGVNDEHVKLEFPHIVYETGPWVDDKAKAASYKKAEFTGKKFNYVSKNAVESFGLSTKMDLTNFTIN